VVGWWWCAQKQNERKQKEKEAEKLKRWEEKQRADALKMAENFR
jgi:hypothetical protein